jgi:hypothetical protein
MMAFCANAAALWLTTFIGVSSAGWAGAQSEAASTWQAESQVTEDIDLTLAQELDGVDRATMQWLRPSRTRLPDNPYTHTDFSAYTLEWGEAKMGLASWTVGILPRTQIGMVVPLSLLGINNVNGKVDLLRLGPLDVAAQGHYYGLGVGSEFKATYKGFGAVASVQLMPRWSMHMGFTRTHIQAAGVPDMSQLPILLNSMAGEDVASIDPETIRQYVDIDASARALTARIAMDVRLNRRDSLILQGQGMMYGAMDTGLPSDLPPIMGLDVALMDGAEGMIPLREAYVASASY